ncbi:MAG: alpha-glucosidase [Lachnospiraceae bacterium]|nr:alpha-glucosidase [Lachnospiraceae bacterium]MBQ4304137.1 alpha-glucosidase [Lachnospiraceae bacterium]
MKKQWWHDKTAYQIYPKSFLDTNGDGIGDLPGIISRLDYLKDLGVDIIWLSPIYVSPLADQGYDIADYYGIDPRFGTMEDMDTLISEARKRDMYIVMDLVVNHCSDEHFWFREACRDPEGKYGRFFYIETVKDGKLPCNWRSYFGGPVWEKLPGHEDKYYLHVFHKKQPDLNWENPDLRSEIYRMINWWLDKGLAGFRIDAIINIKKALPFRDYPADRDDGLCDITNMLRDARGIGQFLGEMRDKTFSPHRAFTVGEVFNEKAEELPDFIGERGYFSTMFDFSGTLFGRSMGGWYEDLEITPDDYRDCVFRAQKKVGSIGFLSNIIENHDEPRGVSRYIPQGEASPVSKKMLATLYFFLRGLPWIYQGQEIGMENVPLRSIDEVDDISSLDNYQVALRAGTGPEKALKAVERFGRDNARTPFQWTGGENAGFTSGKPWLRINPNYRDINLERQMSDPESVCSYYRKLTALRRDPRYKETLVWGDLIPYMEDTHNVFSYFRKSEDQTILIIANYQKEARDLPLPGSVSRVLLTNCKDPQIRDGMISLSGYQAALLLMDEA